LPGFTLLELEERLQGQNYVPLRLEAENIMFLKEGIEMERVRRNRNSIKDIQHTHVLPHATGILFDKSSEIKQRSLGKLQYDQKLQSVQAMLKF
jgi:hypothetical protein